MKPIFLFIYFWVCLYIGFNICAKSEKICFLRLLLVESGQKQASEAKKRQKH